MKEVAKYQCEYCHTEYRERSKCEECENNHKIKLKIDKKYIELIIQTILVILIKSILNLRMVKL